jgi:hypothetical protein
MRKRILGSHRDQQVEEPERGWLDLERIASVEVTSEQPDFPVESIFAEQSGPGWRASQPGDQQIRLLFDRPTAVHRIQLRFNEPGPSRTQEFVLRWAPASGGPWSEIHRQQWNFSPEAPTEVEDYRVDLASVSVLELEIRPDIGGDDAIAGLQSWRLA